LEAHIVVCNESHRFMVAEQLQEITIPESDILSEPCAKNTAPAIALAALQALERGDGRTSREIESRLYYTDEDMVLN
jgi:mannose-1-phosphate guanylyltransferase